MKSKNRHSVLRLLWLSLLLLPFFMGGCDTGSGPQSGLFIAGTYTERADGHEGAIKVSASFSKDSLTGIVIDSHKETIGREAVAEALATIPQAIVVDQTLLVDTVTGATITSKGIIKAVEKCIKKAGGDEGLEKFNESI